MTTLTTGTTSEELFTPSDRQKLHTPNYCEENVFHLLSLARHRGIPSQNLYAFFISNVRRCIPMHHQRSTAGVCFWDYHVIGVIRHDTSALVYDLDSTLPFPTDLHAYARQSMLQALPNGLSVEELYTMGYGHRFRVVRYDELVRSFSSDRRHMLKDRHEWKEGHAEYRSTPPEKPVIKGVSAGHAHTLPLFLNMSEDVGNEGGVDDVLGVPAELCNTQSPGTLLHDVQTLLTFFNPPDAQSSFPQAAPPP